MSKQEELENTQMPENEEGIQDLEVTSELPVKENPMEDDLMFKVS